MVSLLRIFPSRKSFFQSPDYVPPGSMAMAFAGALACGPTVGLILCRPADNVGSSQASFASQSIQVAAKTKFSATDSVQKPLGIIGLVAAVADDAIPELRQNKATTESKKLCLTDEQAHFLFQDSMYNSLGYPDACRALACSDTIEDELYCRENGDTGSVDAPLDVSQYENSELYCNVSKFTLERICRWLGRSTTTDATEVSEDAAIRHRQGGSTRIERHSMQMDGRPEGLRLDSGKGYRPQPVVASCQAKSSRDNAWGAPQVRAMCSGSGLGSGGPMRRLDSEVEVAHQGSSLASSSSAIMGSAVLEEPSATASNEPEGDSYVSAGSSGSGIHPRATATAGTEPPEPQNGESSSRLWGHAGRAPFGLDDGAGGGGTAVTSRVLAGANVHPTAVVHPDAILMEGVEVGPLCTVGAGAKLGPGCKLHPGSHVAGDTELGARCIVYSGAVVGADIPGWTVLGSDNKIGYHAVVGVQCQDMKYKEGSPCYLVMGNGNDVREYASIHRSSKPDDQTVIGNHNLIMGSCHVAHDCKLGHSNILANGTLLGGHVVVEDYVHTGGAVAVHQFCHIGAYSFLAGGSMVARDVPTYTMVAGDRAELRGLNLEGMRRSGFTDVQVKGIRKVYQKLFLSSEAPTGLEDRLAELEANVELTSEPVVRRLVVSVRASFHENRRGICKFRHWVTTDQ